MHAEDLLLDEGRYWKHVEGRDEFFPEADAVPSLTLVVEAVYLCNGLALMITSQQKDGLRELDLVGKE